VINAYKAVGWTYNLRDFAQCQDRANQQDESSGKNQAVQDIKQQLNNALGNMQAKSCYGAKGAINDCETCADVILAHAMNGTFKIEDVDGWHQCKDKDCDMIVNILEGVKYNLQNNGFTGQADKIDSNPKNINRCRGFSDCYTPDNYNKHNCSTCSQVIQAQKEVGDNWIGPYGVQWWHYIQCKPTVTRDGKDEPLRGWDDPM
jgi:hypothetical protein